MYLHFHSDKREKTNKWEGNMLMFHVGVNMKRLGIRFKNNSFQWFRVDSFFQIFAECFRSLRAVSHTAWKVIF